MRGVRIEISSDDCGAATVLAFYTFSVHRHGALSVAFQVPPRGGRLCHSANAFPIWRIIDSDHQVVAHNGRTTTAMAGEFSPPPLLGKHFDLSRNPYSSCCYCSKLQFGITHTLFPNSRRTANSETTSETAAHSDPAQPSLRPSADRMPRSRSSPHCPCRAPPAE